jgi:hypothetical protein
LIIASVVCFRGCFPAAPPIHILNVMTLIVICSAINEQGPQKRKTIAAMDNGNLDTRAEILVLFR